MEEKKCINDMPVEVLTNMFDSAYYHILDTIQKYVVQYGEVFSEQHSNELGIQSDDDETILKIINLFNNDSCTYVRYIGDGQCESTAITALYVVKNKYGYHKLVYCCFSNLGTEYNDDISEFHIDPVNTLGIDELQLIVNTIGNTKKLANP